MGRNLDGEKVTDAVASLLASLEIDIDPDQVTYLSFNRGHLFVGHRSNTDKTSATIVDVYDLTT